MILRTANPPAASDAIEDFEAILGTPLPQDYKGFLMETNGGEQPEPEAFRVAGSGEVSFLSRFFPLGDGTGRDLLAFLRFLKDALPESIIPIGQDIGGNYICMALGGELCGAIYLLDHDQIDGDKDSPDRLIHCAESFSELCTNLFREGGQS